MPVGKVIFNKTQIRKEYLQNHLSIFIGQAKIYEVLKIANHVLIDKINFQKFLTFMINVPVSVPSDENLHFYGTSKTSKT